MSIKVDFKRRVLIASNVDFSVNKELVLSKSIDHHFNLIDLFNDSFETGDYKYWVALNGHGNMDYLWRREIEMEL